MLEQHMRQKLESYATQLALLDQIPGVDWTLAAVIIAELGVDMSVFQNVSQLASWAGVCPGNNESAGKRRSGRIPKGNVYLKTALVEAANSPARALSVGGGRPAASRQQYMTVAIVATSVMKNSLEYLRMRQSLCS